MNINNNIYYYYIKNILIIIILYYKHNLNKISKIIQNNNFINIYK